MGEEVWGSAVDEEEYALGGVCSRGAEDKM